MTRDAFVNEIGRKLKARREALGLTQQQAADGVGVDRASISHWESGKREIRIPEHSMMNSYFKQVEKDRDKARAKLAGAQ
jgi:transcriptional regulator with XRE-family HTH domain